ncbi:MAG: class I SAM-dependent methyltransferase [Gemmatimonadaceae bacterium]
MERYVVGTRLQEFIWKRRRASTIKDSGAAFWTETRDAHRDVIIDAVLKRAPIGSLLEVGCGSGANLYRLALALPGTQFHGLDVNQHVVDETRARFEAMAMTNIALTSGRADVLDMPNDSIDIILCDAVLMYVGPDKIGRTLSELLRVARKSVLLSEWLGAEGARSTYHYGHWLHDYVSMLRHRVARVQTNLYPPTSWADSSWRQYGHLIEIDV